MGKKIALIILLASMLLLGPIWIRPVASATETTNSISIGFDYNFWDLDKSVTIPLVPWIEDLEVGVDSGFILSMPSTISITTANELVSPTTQSIAVTLATQQAHFQLNFTGYLRLSGVYDGEYNFIDIGFNEYFDPLEPVHIEGFDLPLLQELVVEMGVSIDLSIDAYVTADLYRGDTLLEHLRWEDSGETKSFSYTIPEVSSPTTDTFSIKNITWGYDIILNPSFYATIDIVVWSGSKDIFTIPFSLPLATEEKIETTSVSCIIRPPIPPSVSFTTLTSNATINGVYTVGANATDDKRVNRVEFWVDEVKKFTGYNSPYNWSFDTTSYSDGIHTVKIVAYDDDEKSAYQQYSVNVGNIELPSVGQGIEKMLIILVVIGITLAAVAATAIYLRRR
jgi:hypothetical protein